jgi:hypothetical protein
LRVRNAFFAFVALAGLALGSCAPDRSAGPPLVLSGLPEPEARLARALDAFEQLTLWREASGAAGGNLEPTGGLRRWNQALRVRLSGNSSSNERTLLLRYLEEAAAIAGLEVRMLEGAGTDENFKIEFFPEYMAPPVLQGAGCVARSWWNGQGALTRVELYIRSGSRGYARCVSHEILHGFGFPAHPHDLHSVMSYTHQGFSDYTAIDKETLKLLYNAELRPGLFHLPAMVAARQVLAREMGLGDPEALARPVLDRAVARLRAFAEGPGDRTGVVRGQLGNAYWFGQYVAQDRAEGQRWWTLGAERGHADSRYRLGMAVRDADPARGFDLVAAAAGQAHPSAMLEAGRMLRDGRGRTADPVEAQAWFIAGAERNAQGAAADRDALAGRLDADQQARARARAGQLVPAR